MARTHLIRRTWLALGATVLFFAIPLVLRAAAGAAPAQPSQIEVEEVYLFDFVRFVQWPAGADQGPLTICVAGLQAFSAGLEKVVANESVAGRPLAVRRVAHAGDESGCAILFIDSSAQALAKQLLDSLAGKAALTVSDTPDFLSHGGMIQFQLVDKRVRFSVNLDAVHRAHLAMSSELLKVALNVKGRSPEGGAQ